jgi:hypothetical protein
VTPRLRVLMLTGLLGLLGGGCRPHEASESAEASVSLPPVDADVAAAKGDARRVFIANHGKLVGAMSGFAWVAGGEGTFFQVPNPCDEKTCFKGTGNALCTRGTIPALRCVDPGASVPSCNWETKWGAKMGFNVSRPGEPWGPAAPGSFSIEYTGGPMRLTVHRASDPPGKDYCVDRYASGTMVSAARFRTQCWEDQGELLSDFASVDKIGLQIPSARDPSAFDYCISAIWTQSRPDAP